MLNVVDLQVVVGRIRENEFDGSIVESIELVKGQHALEQRSWVPSLLEQHVRDIE